MPWESEFIDSQRVWAEYALKRQEANAQNRYCKYIMLALSTMFLYKTKGNLNKTTFTCIPIFNVHEY